MTLDSKKIKSVNPKENQSWIFIGRTDAEAEAPLFWPPDAKSWPIGKDADAGKDWGQEENGAAEDEIIREHHPLNGCEFEQTLGDSGQRSVAGSSPRNQSQMWLSEWTTTASHLYLLQGTLYIVARVAFNTWTGMWWPVQVPTVVTNWWWLQNHLQGGLPIYLPTSTISNTSHTCLLCRFRTEFCSCFFFFFFCHLSITSPSPPSFCLSTSYSCQI